VLSKEADAALLRQHNVTLGGGGVGGAGWGGVGGAHPVTACGSSLVLMAILRGLAFSATGMRSVSTPPA
jgi:hypothetical protein